MRQEFSNERGNDPRIWIKNLSGWKLTGNRTPTFGMTGPNALSIKLVEPTGEQAIVSSWYIRWWTWLSYLYRQFKILAISSISVQIISTIGWLALKIERCVRSSQTSGFDYRSSLNFFRFFFQLLTLFVQLRASFPLSYLHPQFKILFISHVSIQEYSYQL